MIIALIGFMGCGKSSVGRELATLLCCPFMDLDEVIEASEGRSIPEIFASDGEAAFRRMEVEALKRIISDMSLRGATATWQSPQCVLALGGGTVMTKECAEMVRENTTCIYLRTEVETLVARLADEADGRPMLRGASSPASADMSLRGAEQLGTSSPASADMSLRGAEQRGNLRCRIEELMTRRSETYEHTAHMTMDTDGKTIGQVAEEIHGILVKKC